MAKPMTDEEIRRELDVCDGAQLHPYFTEGTKQGFVVMAKDEDDPEPWMVASIECFIGEDKSGEAHATAIAHALNGYPAALREVLRLRARLAEVQWNGDDSQCVFGCGHDRHDMHHHASCDYNTFGTEEVE